jgi:hypothetical protein
MQPWSVNCSAGAPNTAAVSSCAYAHELAQVEAECCACILVLGHSVMVGSDALVWASSDTCVRSLL